MALFAQKDKVAFVTLSDFATPSDADKKNQIECSYLHKEKKDKNFSFMWSIISHGLSSQLEILCISTIAGLQGTQRPGSIPDTPHITVLLIIL